MNLRSVDWPNLPECDRIEPTMRRASANAELASLLSAFDELLDCTPADTVIKRAVEIARERIGLARVAIFMRDQARGVMRGTWGTDLEGETVDEHSLSFDIWEGDLELYDRNSQGDGHWTVVDDAPIVVHLPTETQVVGRGWVCCTPIRAGQRPLGMMFNDAGLTGASIDEQKQARGAMLCSLLGTALDVAQRRGDSWAVSGSASRTPGVLRAAEMLGEDPALTAEEIGARLSRSASRVARTFKAEMGVSLVEYRNRLRLERFSSLLDQNGDNILDAALAAGFGSYAQFHRVFVAFNGTTPGKFIKQRASRRK